MIYSPVELHCHTTESDGSMTIDTLVRRAVERGLCGLALTDHNTVSGVSRVAKECEANGLAFLPGIEWTTFGGHITVLGGNSQVNWREVVRDTVDDCIIRAANSGDAVIVAHPKRAGAPICCGCHMDFDITAWDRVSGMEVWSNVNPFYSLQNVLTRPYWLHKLSLGARLATVYGYDWHRSDEGCPPYAMTFVGHDGELNGDKMLSAIKARHTYISTGVQLELSHCEFTFGDEIKSGDYQVSLAAARYEKYPPEYDVRPTGVRIIDAHGNVDEMSLIDASNFTLHISTEYTLIEVFGLLNGRECTLAIASPIYQTTEE